MHKVPDSYVPKVSLVMTLYNASTFLAEAVESVINQTLPCWELIAVDDGSSDNSLDILRHYTDSRIRVFSFEQNFGRTAALNFGCRQSTADYIAILDADDIASPNRLQIQCDFLDDNKCVGIVAGFADFIDRYGRIISYYKPLSYPEQLNACLSWSMPIVHSTMMIRRSILMDECNGYSDDFSIGHDWHLCVKVAKSYPIYVLPFFLGSWRKYPSSMTGNRANFIKGRLESIDILIQAKSLCNSMEAVSRNRHAMAVNAAAISYYLFRQMHLIEAINFISMAFSFDIFFFFRVNKVKMFFGWGSHDSCHP